MLLVLPLLFAGAARAQTAHVENRCSTLGRAEYEELDARIQLLFKNEARDRALPAVVCGAEGSWVEWQGRRHPIVGRGAIEDEVVDIVEAELHAAERQAEADPRTAEAQAVAAGQPMLERGAGASPAPPAATRPADPVALRASDARGGGIALGIETELPSETVGISIGPSFDFATSMGPVMVGGREAFRLASSTRDVLFMDFQATVGYGAPLDPGKLFGVVGRFGAEWMVAYPEGNSGQAAVAPCADLGLRVQSSYRVLSLWAGIDARFRLSKLTLRSSSSLVANDVSASLSLGVAFVDWSRK